MVGMEAAKSSSNVGANGGHGWSRDVAGPLFIAKSGAGNADKAGADNAANCGPLHWQQEPSLKMVLRALQEECFSMMRTAGDTV
jgi:hypothetical protein